MQTQNKARAGCDPARGMSCNCAIPCATCNCIEINKAEQILTPRMGTALRSFLKRYADELRPVADQGDRLAQSMIDCCNFLLIEADRLERGRP